MCYVHQTLELYGNKDGNMKVALQSEVVAVYDLADIVLGTDGADDIRLRLEIVRNPGVTKNPLSVRVWRREYFRLSPTFWQLSEGADRGGADERILVEDDFFGQFLEPIHGEAVNDVLDQAIRCIEEALKNTEE